jgi:hypothetical protein
MTRFHTRRSPSTWKHRALCQKTSG